MCECFDVALLRPFTPEELGEMISGEVGSQWTLQDLSAHVLPAAGGRYDRASTPYCKMTQ